MVDLGKIQVAGGADPKKTDLTIMQCIQTIGVTIIFLILSSCATKPITVTKTSGSDHVINFHLIKVQSTWSRPRNVNKLENEITARITNTKFLDEISAYYRDLQRNPINLCIHGYDKTIKWPTEGKHSDITEFKLGEIYSCIHSNSDSCSNLTAKDYLSENEPVVTTSACDQLKPKAKVVDVIGLITNFKLYNGPSQIGMIVGRDIEAESALREKVKRQLIATFIPSNSSHHDPLKNKDKFIRLLAHEFGHTLNFRDYTKGDHCKIKCRDTDSSDMESYVLMQQFDVIKKKWCREFSSPHKYMMNECRADSELKFYPDQTPFSPSTLNLKCGTTPKGCEDLLNRKLVENEILSLDIYGDNNDEYSYSEGEPIFIKLDIDNEKIETNQYQIYIDVKNLSNNEVTRNIYPNVFEVAEEGSKTKLVANILLKDKDWVFKAGESENVKYELQAKIYFSGEYSVSNSKIVRIDKNESSLITLDNGLLIGSAISNNEAFDVDKNKLFEIDEANEFPINNEEFKQSRSYYLYQLFLANNEINGWYDSSIDKIIPANLEKGEKRIESANIPIGFDDKYIPLYIRRIAFDQESIEIEGGETMGYDLH